MQRYRSGHNGADSKSVCGQPHVGSNPTRSAKNPHSLERHSKGQFYKNTAYLERGMPYFAFVSTNAVLVSKIDKS